MVQACVCTTKNTDVSLSDRMGFVWCKHAYVQPRTGVALSVKMGFAQTLKKMENGFFFLTWKAWENLHFYVCSVGEFHNNG